MGGRQHHGQGHEHALHSLTSAAALVALSVHVTTGLLLLMLRNCSAPCCACMQIYEGKVEPFVMSDNCTDAVPVLIRRATFCSAFAADARDFRSYNSWVRACPFWCCQKKASCFGFFWPHTACSNGLINVRLHLLNLISARACHAICSTRSAATSWLVHVLACRSTGQVAHGHRLNCCS